MNLSQPILRYKSIVNSIVHSKAESVSLVKLSHVVLGLFEWRDRHCTMELKDNGKKQKKNKNSDVPEAVRKAVEWEEREKSLWREWFVEEIGFKQLT